VWLPAGVLGYVEDRWARMHSSVVKVQAFRRMRKDRLSFERMHAAATFFQSAWRAREARAAYAKALCEHAAAVVIQRSYRQHAAQQQCQRARSAAGTIQAAWRRYKLQQRVCARVAVRIARERAQQEAQDAARREHEEFKDLKEQYSIKRLSEVEAALSCYDLLRRDLKSGEPGEITDALSQLEVLRGIASTRHGGNLSAQQLKQALQLSAICQVQLGPGVSEQQLRYALTAAAVCRQQLGGGNLQELHDALAIAAVCKVQLGGYDVEQLQQHLSASQVAVQQLNGSISSLSVVLQLGQACCTAGLQDPVQLQGTLQLASAAAGAASVEEVERALGLQQAVLAAVGPGATNDIVFEQVVAALELQVIMRVSVFLVFDFVAVLNFPLVLPHPRGVS
jgi:hypothetical protein